MRAHIVENGIVVNTIEVDSLDFLPGLIDGEVGGIGWTYENGQLSPPAPPVKTPEEVQLDVVTKTQERLDTFAKTRNYAGMLSLCTYSVSLVPKFAAEGQYGVQLRDDTWSKCYEILAEVEAGTRPLPSGYEEIAPELPTPEWPA